MKRTIFLFIGASILLVGCSSTYGSREEASGAADEWVADSRLVVVRFPPNEQKLRTTIQTLKGANEENCRVAEQWRDGAMAHEGFMAGSEAVRKNCSYEVLFVDEDVVARNLSKDKTQRTRWCDEEKETKQFVCKEKDVNESIAATESTPMSGSEWGEVETTYTYFRH